MGFGILPVEKRLGLEQDFRIGDLEDILATMRRLDVSPTGGGVQELLRLAQVHPGENAGFSHLIGIVAPIMPIRSSSILRMRKPADTVVGLNCHIERPIQRALDQLRSICDAFETLRKFRTNDRKMSLWLNEVAEDCITRPMEFLNQVRDYHEQTTTWFCSLHKDYPSFKYHELLRVHISHAVHFLRKGLETFRSREGESNHPDCPYYGLRLSPVTPLLCEGNNHCFTPLAQLPY